jgi:hypothetical protein
VSNVFLVLLVGVQALTLTFLGVSLYKGQFTRYLCLSLYAVGLLAGDVTRQLVRYSYGFSSKQYFYAYFIADICIVVLKYLAILSVFDIILRDSPLRAQVRWASTIFFCIVAGMSYALISGATAHFKSKLIVELQQNLHFASVVLAALLCLSLAQLRVATPWLRILVCGFGVSGASQASVWALQNLVPQGLFRSWWTVNGYIGPIATMAMMALWCYAFASLRAGEPALEYSESPTEEETGFLLHPAVMKAEVGR